MATSCGSCMEPPSSPMKQGAILLAQLAGNHARRAETPLTSSMPLWRREWGQLVTTTFTGPLGARSRVSEQMYCASFSASRSVKLRATCLNTSSTVSIASLNHNSAAIDIKRPYVCHN